MDPTQLPLRDIHLPDALGWWPLAPGWWFLILLAASGLVYFLYKEFLKWRRNAARRVALSELRRVRTEYEAGADALVLAKELSELLRRATLAYAPRGEVAGLTGESWLEWLDRGLDDRPFTTGTGRTIESLPYVRPESVSEDVDMGGLIDIVQRRLRTPFAEVAR
jgi:hypothetical protein